MIIDCQVMMNADEDISQNVWPHESISYSMFAFMDY